MLQKWSWRPRSFIWRVTHVSVCSFTETPYHSFSSVVFFTNCECEHRVSSCGAQKKIKLLTRKKNIFQGELFWEKQKPLSSTAIFQGSESKIQSYQTFYFRFLNKKITCIFSLVEFLLLFLRFVVLHFFPSSPGISNFSLAKDVVLQQTPVWPKGVFFLVKLILGLWPHSPFLCRAPVFFMHSISTHLTHSMLS